MKEDLPKKAVRVRAAPSPTGRLHIGTARLALFNWLFARKQGGAFVLRIEDTDKERSKKEYEDELIAGLTWLGIAWDEGPAGKGEVGDQGPYRQSERTEIYKKYLNQLIEKGDAYYCYCTKEELEAQKQAMAAQGLPQKYSGHCRNLSAPPDGRMPQVIRFKVPEVTVTFKDIIRGTVTFDAGLFGDIAIAKDLTTPLHHLAVVVDDELMHISHVIRGEDLLSNTPRQILIQKALGFSEPIYAHLPLILNPDRSKMSKRFGDTALSEYRAKGYLPDAMVNFLALLSWHPKDDREIMGRDELVELFDIARVQKAGAVFNQDKLNWLNREYLKKMSDREIADMLVPMAQEEKIEVDIDTLSKIVAVARGRASTLRDFLDGSAFFFSLPDYAPKMLVWQKAPSPKSTIAAVLTEAGDMLGKLAPGDFDRETLLAAVNGIVHERQKGEVFWPLRVALSGQASSPDPIDIMVVLGKQESLRRIGLAAQKLAE